MNIKNSLLEKLLSSVLQEETETKFEHTPNFWIPPNETPIMPKDILNSKIVAPKTRGRPKSIKNQELLSENEFIHNMDNIEVKNRSITPYVKNLMLQEFRRSNKIYENNNNKLKLSLERVSKIFNLPYQKCFYILEKHF